MARCADCGYLALRKTDDRSLVDAEEDYRTKADNPSQAGTRYKVYDEFPICFVRALDLAKAISKPFNPAATVAVLEHDRDCGEFTDWQQGFTPKEHLEMNLLKEERERIAKLQEREREWRREDVALIKAGMRTSVRTQLVVAIIGALAALAAVVFGYSLANAGKFDSQQKPAATQTETVPAS